MAAIASVLNVMDGVQVDVTLASAPQGTLAFTASRNVGSPGALAPYTAQGGLVYRLNLTGVVPDEVSGAAVPVWITASDSAGASSQSPCWLRYGTQDDLWNEIAKGIQGILVPNKPLLDLRLQQFAPSGKTETVQAIITGMSQEARVFPAIDISVVQEHLSPYELHPLTDLITPTISIVAFAFHQGDISWKRKIAALGQGIRDVLAQEQYLTVVLPSGISLTRVHCDDISFAEADYGDKRFQTAAEVTVSCELNYPYT